jgi:hypothetical protein
MGIEQTKKWLQQGSAGILALISMALLGVLGTAYVAMSSTEVSTGAQYRDGISAQYLAEAGGRWAAIQLKNKVAAVVTASDTAGGVVYNSGAIGTAPTAGSYSVTIRRNPALPADNQRRQIIVTGNVGQASRRVVFTVVMGDENPLPVKYGGFGGGNARLAGTVVGDMGATEVAILNWGYSVTNIEAAQINYPNGTTATGTAAVGTVVVVLPPIPVSFDINNAAYQQYRAGAVTQAAGNLTNPAASWAGNNYINGNLTLRGAAVLATAANTGIYVNGNFTINNNCTINAAGNLAIIATGTITIDPGKINIPVGSMLTLYAQNGVTVTSGSTITGNTTIISPGVVNFSGDGKIIVGNGGIINVYTQQNFTATSGMSFRVSNAAAESAAFTIMSEKNISISGGTPFNPGVNGTVKLYAGGTFALSGGSTIGGYGLVMAADTSANSVRLTGGSTAANTVFISAGDIYSASTTTGALIAANTLTIDYGSVATFSQSVLDAVGLAATPYSMSLWNNQ